MENLGKAAGEAERNAGGEAKRPETGRKTRKRIAGKKSVQMSQYRRWRGSH